MEYYMKCPICQHENKDKAKFCRKCGSVLELICPKCKSVNEPDSVFCEECGTKISYTVLPTQATVSIPKLEDMHSQLQSLIPDILAQKYLSAEQTATGENRPITALFADISGFTPLSATKSSEVIFQMVQDCFKQLVSIVAKYEGSISGFRGDGLLALFGAPILHENDAERAILAAIDMKEAIKDHQLQVSIGINTAMMTVGEIQTQLHNEYTAYGTDINLAKRLQESAEPGQILVGGGSHRLTRRAFDFDIISDLTMKGFTQPVTAYSVKQSKAHPEKLRGIEGLRARMIGREHEFTEVKEAVDEWLTGHGQIVSVIGEAGIGKSRLVSELKAYLTSREDRQFQYFEGRCISIGQPISYLPFIDILRTYFNLGEIDDISAMAQKVIDGTKLIFLDSADETLPFLGHLLSIPFGNELDDKLKFATPEQIRHQTLMQLRDMFSEMAKKQPLMLILEDLHWADELSLDLISHLMDGLSHAPLMIVCVYRPESESRAMKLGDQAQRKCLDKYTDITLKPLSRLQSRQLVEDLLNIDNLPESVRDVILQKSEGNPFFIEEVIRSLIEQEFVYREDDRWKANAEIKDINVPDTIQSVVLSRVDRLKEEARHVLQCASVIGRLFRYSLLDHLTQYESKLNDYLNEFEERDLVYEERAIPELEYAFKHAFTQEATYQGILERGRKSFHNQVALGIEKIYQERLEDYYDELAHHYSRSDNAEKAIEYLLKAGEKAKRNYANDIAISYYQSVLDILEKHNITHDDWKLEALKGLGEVYFGVGQIAEAVQILEKAVALAEEIKIPARQLVRLYFVIGDAIWWQSKYKDVLQYGEKAVSALGDDDRCLEAILANYLVAIGNSYMGNNEIFKECIYKIMTFINNIEYSSELRSVYIHILSCSFYNDRDLAATQAWSNEFEKRAESHNDLRALADLSTMNGWIAGAMGNLEMSNSLFQKSINTSNRIGDKKHMGRASLSTNQLLYSQGKIEEAKSSALITIKLLEEIGTPSFLAGAYLNLASISICQQLWDDAINYYHKYIEMQEKIGVQVYIEWAKLRLGRAYMKKGDYDKAIEIFNNFADKVFEFQDEYAQYRLLNLMEGFEALYKAKGDRDGFLNFYHSYKQAHADEMEKLTLPQLYLEPMKISNDLSNLAFADDFDKETIDASWQWIDVFNDCHYNIVENGLEIHAVNGRDLSGLNLSAPRLMIETSGDFAVQVCISPASKDKPKIGGLLLWKDDKNYICFERGDSDPDGFQFYGYINKEQLMAGRGFLPEEADMTYIRLARIGDEFTSYCSTDGENWLTCGKMTLPMEDPIQVGIHAIGMIDRTIYCGEYKEGTATLFRNFRIWNKG
jgi:class 3 adenylate cyclase/tetratricopeptide (TPR) repeat protein/regulation of enolase protein 1 (concanavalin A-like superfamily)